MMGSVGSSTKTADFGRRLVGRGATVREQCQAHVEREPRSALSTAESVTEKGLICVWVARLE
ncbi:Protein of unknown function [Gryllus bimaculatus]|nr:Protein of unknown function [Gryllus bimaculatus]